MAISPQRLTIYLYSAHRAVIFAIAQLSCTMLLMQFAINDVSFSSVTEGRQEGQLLPGTECGRLQLVTSIFTNINQIIVDSSSKRYDIHPLVCSVHGPIDADARARCRRHANARGFAELHLPLPLAIMVACV